LKNKLIEEFERITDSLLELTIDDDIESVIKNVEELMEKRESIISEIETNNQEVYISPQLLQKNYQLQEKLSEISTYLSKSIMTTKHEKSLSSRKRKANKGYLNPGHHNDGYFIDKKK
jgi:hypothetical protein